MAVHFFQPRFRCRKQFVVLLPRERLLGVSAFHETSLWLPASCNKAALAALPDLPQLLRTNATAPHSRFHQIKGVAPFFSSAVTDVNGINQAGDIVVSANARAAIISRP